MKNEARVCKNKKCQKVLPVGYKYKCCEACRNQHAEALKNGFKFVGAVGVVTLGRTVITKINPKK